MTRPSTGGWWEEYKCGCVSKTVRTKKELRGYCPKHGADRRHIYPERLPDAPAKGE